MSDRQPTRLRLHILVVALLVSLPCVLYANTLQNEYHLDDYYRIVDNPALDRVWPPWRHFFDATTSSVMPVLVHYRPLLPLSLSINHWLSDTLGVSRLAGLHAGNIAIHIATTVLLFYFFVAIMSFLKVEPIAETEWVGASFWAALIFAVHPIGGIAVNYLSKRDVLLMALFAVAALLIYVRMRLQGRLSVGSIGAATLLFLFAVLSREEAVAVVLVVFVLEWLRSIQPGEGRLPRWIVWVLVGVAAITFERRGPWILRTASSEYARQQLEVHAREYLVSMVWPFRVRILPEVTAVEGLLDPWVMAGLALIGFSVYWAWRWRTKSPVVSFCVLAYWALILPSSSILKLKELAAPYRQHGSLAFVCLLGMVLLFTWVPPRRAHVLAAGVVLWFGLAGHSLNTVWRDSASLWAHNLRYGGTATAHLNYARSLSVADPELAEEHFRIALEREPDNIFALINFGILEIQTGRVEEGLSRMHEAQKLAPRRGLPHFWLAQAYAKLGRDNEARAASLRAADLTPGNVTYQYQAARALHLEGQLESSLKYLARVRGLAPDYRDSAFLEAFALQQVGRWQEAKPLYERFLATHPAHAKARFNLAYGLAQVGRCQDAIPELESLIGSELSSEAQAWLAKCREDVAEPE